MSERIKTGRVQIDWRREHFVSFEGQIDEATDLDDLATRLDDHVVVDLERVSVINSIGLREWVRLIQGLQERGVLVTLTRCSEATASSSKASSSTA